MASTSDSRHPDDMYLHLGEVLDANKARMEPDPGETAADAVLRTSVLLSEQLRQRVEQSLSAVGEAVPGIGAAENKKLQTSAAARSARAQGRTALARVDSHLQSVTGARNPTEGHTYGVYGSNPRSFGGVYRALRQSLDENARVAALPESDPGRRFLFTPVIQASLTAADEHLASVLGDRTETRAKLSRKVAIKTDVLNEARATISAVRHHLYANLTLGKKDPDLREYGFLPVRRRRGSQGDEEEVEEGAEGEE
jgi:hypothetical protein